MKKNTLRVIATLLACATLASGSATAMADEASLPSMDEVPNSAAIEHEAHSLSVQPTADKQYAYPAEAEASGIFPTKNANALQSLNDTDDVPQSRGAVGNVAKALKVAAKIFSGAKWLGDLSGFLQKPENWAAGKIEQFLRQHGVNASTAHCVAQILANIYNNSNISYRRTLNYAENYSNNYLRLYIINSSGNAPMRHQ